MPPDPPGYYFRPTWDMVVIWYASMENFDSTTSYTSYRGEAKLRRQIVSYDYYGYEQKEMQLYE